MNNQQLPDSRDMIIDSNGLPRSKMNELVLIKYGKSYGYANVKTQLTILTDIHHLKELKAWMEIIDLNNIPMFGGPMGCYASMLRADEHIRISDVEMPGAKLRRKMAKEKALVTKKENREATGWKKKDWPPRSYIS